MKSFKLAMVAPPFGITGGPEQVVYNLTEELVHLGVDVTLFAPADWTTSAKHITTLTRSMWNMPELAQLTEEQKNQLIIQSQQKVLDHQEQFDLIHLHSQRFAARTAHQAKRPCVLSIHSMINLEDFATLKQVGIYTITVSQAQRGQLDSYATIHNGIPVPRVTFSLQSGKYLIFVGRLNQQKGIDRAVSLARQASKPLWIFGRIGNDPERKKFFETKVKPFLGSTIVYCGEASHDDIYRYLREASALLLPISKPETNSLAGMEALASGTPLIGTTQGPLPELFGRHPEIACLADDDAALVQAIRRVDQCFDRRACRLYAEKHFDSRQMAEKYLAVYKRILKL